MMSSERGVIVSFEGIDSSGKDTQSRMLFDYLKGCNVDAVLLSFPVYSTPIGREIKSFLSGERRSYGTEARHLLYAANRYELKPTIDAFLVEQKTLIINRYCESNFAYGVANGLPLKWLREVESRMPHSNLVIYLKLDPEVSMARKARMDRYEADLNLQRRAAEVYDALVEPGRWLVVDANRDRDTVHREVVGILNSLVMPQLAREEKKKKKKKPPSESVELSLEGGG